MNKKRFRKDTEMVCGGSRHDDSTGSLTYPIHQTSTYVFRDAKHGRGIFTGEEEGYVYTRYANPTTELLEERVARLEHTDTSVFFSSGMSAAMALFLSLAKTGDNFVADELLYGGTHSLLKSDLAKLGIEVRRCDTNDIDRVESLIDDRTKLIFTETPANPTMKIVDIGELSKLSRSKGIPLAVDSTLGTPYLQRPIDLGADIVMHSATKYLGGHGDVIAGVLCGSTELMEPVRYKRRNLGSCISPFDSWLILRGLKTLGVRMERACKNAQAVAEFLEAHPKVEKVYYPGLSSSPYHELAAKQMDGFGAMISFDLKGGYEAGVTMMNNVQVIVLAVSIGDVHTLIQHPAGMSHHTYTEEELAEVSIKPGTVRLSVGIEDSRDMIEDLAQCLEKM